MVLPTHKVSFGQPGAEIRVEITRQAQAKGMQVISGRECLDLPKPWMLEPPGKHDVSVEPGAPGRHLGERHPHLKRNARLLRENPNGADLAENRNHLVEEGSNLGRLASKVMGQRVSTTGMGLIPVGE